MEMRLNTEDLKYALKFIVAGYFFDVLTNIEKNDLTNKAFGNFKISEKDKSVLKLFADGLSPDDIAQKLYMSKNLVNQKIDDILAKFKNNEKTKAAEFILNNKSYVL